MKIVIKTGALLFLLAAIGQPLSAQYTVNGNAQQVSCNQYRLTQESFTLSGSVWNNIKIDLTQPFDFKFDVFLGNNNSPGADGIAFVLQPISTSVGSTGGGLGYENITPAVGITIDTYQNGNNSDPAYDHIAIQLNGDLNHTSANNIAGPVQAISGNDNIEDGQWHALRVTWDAAAKTLTAYVDGVLRVSAVKDIVTDVLSGNPQVYWGFTGSTGGEFNLQQFKTALNPYFHFAPNQKRCVGESITFFDSTISFTNIAKFYWDFGDGSAIDSVNLNPVHTYTTAGDYTVIQRVIGANGCEATNTQIVRIGSKPVARFGYTNHCIPMPPYPSTQFSDSSFATVGTVNNWYWDFDNGQTATAQNPNTNYITAGNKIVKLAVKTLEGCESDTLTMIAPMYAQPVIDFTATDSVCLGSPMQFFGTVSSSSHPITNWLWRFPPDTTTIRTQNATYTFTTPGNHNVLFMATSSGNADCLGMKTKTVFVADKPHAAIKSQFICSDIAIVLQDSSYTTDGIAITNWWWDLGNGQFSTQQNPTVTYTITGPVTIKLVVTNSRGCISDTLVKTINVQQNAIANFGYSNPLCDNVAVQFSDSSSISGGTITQWSWIHNGTVISTVQNPSRVFAAGIQTVGLVVNNITGCKSDTLYETFVVNARPVISMNFSNACNQTPVAFTGTNMNGIAITDWKWSYGDGNTGNGINTQHTYGNEGVYTVSLAAVSVNGCVSGTLQKNIIIYSTHAFAGNDTIAAAGQPVQLHATGGINYTWTPATGLNNPNITDPVAILSTTQTFTVKAFTPQGCESFDDVTVKIYKGPDIYLPNAFTPNGDGLNDLYRGIPVGIQQFHFLKVFNRYGELVFYSTDHRRGWDGLWKGKKQEAGVFVVIASGADFRGNPVNKKQSFVLIR